MTSPPVESPSNRSFGFTVGGVLAVFGSVRVGLSVLNNAAPSFDSLTLTLWTVGGTLIALALFRPAWLALPNRLWHQLGLLLAQVINPIVLLLLYATCIVPIGVLMRAFGHDPLQLKRDETTDTYWVAHKPSPLAKPMRHLF